MIRIEVRENDSAARRVSPVPHERFPLASKCMNFGAGGRAMLDTDRDLEMFPGYEGTAVRFLNESRKAGGPISIGINGKFSLAIDDDKSFRMLLDLVDWLEGIEDVRQGLKELDEGKGISLEEVKERLRAKHGTPL
jgi:hypothetical protein